jgi:hypothetical protein
MIKMITNPDQYFARKIGLDISFKEPILIHLFLVFIISITTLVVDYSFYKGDLLDAYSSVDTFTSLLLLTCTVFLVWVIDSLTIYILQHLFSGKGSFKRILQFTAHSNIAWIIPLFLGTLYSNLLFYNSSIVDSGQMYRLVNATTVIVIILRANILRFGLKNACVMPLKNSTALVIFYSLCLIYKFTNYIKMNITIGLLALAILLVVLIMVTLSSTKYPRLTSAKQLRIDAEKSGEWTDIDLTFLDSSISEKTEESITNFLNTDLDSKELSIKDGSSLLLIKKENGITEDHVEVNTIVFNENEDAKKYFDYVNLKKEGTKISGLGDEAAIYSTKADDQRNYLIRISNAFVDIMVHSGNKGRVIAEQIIKKSRDIKP